jgi:hypothetical protein
MFPMKEKTTRDGKNISTIIFLTEEFGAPKIKGTAGLFKKTG